MDFERYYVMRPQESLHQYITEHPELAWLQTSVLWSIGEGKYFPWNEQDYQLFAKLSFLLDIYRRWGKSDNPVKRKSFNGLLVPSPFTSQTYDQWWGLEPIQLGAGVHGVLKYVTVDDLKHVAVTGNPRVDEFLDYAMKAAVARSKK